MPVTTNSCCQLLVRLIKACTTSPATNSAQGSKTFIQNSIKIGVIVAVTSGSFWYI